MQRLHLLLARLLEYRVEFVLVGGLAAMSHGSSLITQDVDVCMPMSADNLLRLQDALNDLRPVHRMRRDIPLALTRENAFGYNNPYLDTDLGQLDCLGEVLGIGGYEEVVRQSIIVQFPPGPTRVLQIESLIRAKEAMGRPHDLIAAQHLRAVLREREKLGD